ncbi:MAG: hypothetical protein LBQ94_06260 [Treponema sp.]|jgi:hypothetical protein|nr:hypothetical protein [Treponema sp.]
MKKTVFAALVVLLALLAVTCDGGFIPSGKPAAGGEVEYVTVTIGVSERARTMSQPLAADEIDFYEVVFKAGSEILRGTASVSGGVITPNPWIVTIPIGTYAGDTNKAVLFAGKSNSATDKTLLAVGEITSNPYITVNSPVTFTLYAIRTGVNENGDDSYFKITWPYTTSGSSATVDPSFKYRAPEMVDVNGDGTDYPAFLIPHDTESPGIRATYRFNVPSEEFVVITAPGATVLQPGDTGFTPTIAGIGRKLPTITVSGAPGDFPGGGYFTLGIGTKNLSFTDGQPDNYADNLAAFNISIPVKAITEAQTTGGAVTDLGEQWYIRGGLNNTALDDGDDTVSSTSRGGVVLLKLLGKTGSEINPVGP